MDVFLTVISIQNVYEHDITRKLGFTLPYEFMEENILNDGHYTHLNWTRPMTNHSPPCRVELGFCCNHWQLATLENLLSWTSPWVLNGPAHFIQVLLFFWLFICFFNQVFCSLQWNCFSSRGSRTNANEKGDALGEWWDREEGVEGREGVLCVCAGAVKQRLSAAEVGNILTEEWSTKEKEEKRDPQMEWFYRTQICECKSVGYIAELKV